MKNLNFEKLTSDQLYSILFKEENYSMLSSRVEDLKRRIPFFSSDQYQERWGDKNLFFCIFDGDKIIAIALVCYHEQKTVQGHNWFLSYISVDEEYRNRGYGKYLLYKVFEFIDSEIFIPRKEFGFSSYEPDGERYLKKHIEKWKSERALCLPGGDKLEYEIKTKLRYTTKDNLCLHQTNIK